RMTRQPTPMPLDTALQSALVARHGETFGVADRGWRAWRLQDTLHADVAETLSQTDLLLADGELDAATLERVAARGAMLIQTEREGGQWIDT
ncbi:hypothetical protein NYZ21_21190, partial [Acinetobacter baumannii]|nr:hypothetical protein [Acinetobacter baumannii]